MANFQYNKLSLVMQNMDTKHADYFNSLHRDDRLFLQHRTEHFPIGIQNLLINRYKSHADQVKANIDLRYITDRLNSLLPAFLLNNFNASEDELRDLAQSFADICRNKILNMLRQPQNGVNDKTGLFSKINLESSTENSDQFLKNSKMHFKADSENFRIGFLKNSKLISKTVNAALRANTESFKKIPEKNSVNASVRNTAHNGGSVEAENSVNASSRNEAQLLAYEKCADFVNALGLTAPTPDKSKTLTGCIMRMQDKRWWLRTLRKIMVRKTEECMLQLNKVHKHAGIYCSDITASNRKFQKARQLKMMEGISLVNEHDQRYSLREIYELNPSNPINRRNELMTRMRGFEDIAKELGHIGDFITLTCPSKYHAAYAKSGDRNPNWQGFTPQQGQQYLCGIWAKIRAELDRQEIRTYGLRVAEPQHDGTPHWHMMLFVEPEHLKAFRAVISHYAFQEDGDEAGLLRRHISVLHQVVGIERVEKEAAIATRPQRGDHLFGEEGLGQFDLLIHQRTDARIIGVLPGRSHDDGAQKQGQGHQNGVGRGLLHAQGGAQ